MGVFIFSPVSTPVYKSQIGFMGVARRAGKQPKLVPEYKYKPKAYTYVQKTTIDIPGVDASGNPAPAISVFQLITDYDFDLLDLKLVYEGTGLPDVVAKIMLWDSVKQQTSNIPMLDTFWNGAPDSKYENGAIVPPLLYPRQSQIRLDLYSQVSAATLPIAVTVHFTGANRFPCA